jgi:hypothetical protein
MVVMENDQFNFLFVSVVSTADVGNGEPIGQRTSPIREIKKGTGSVVGCGRCLP